MLGLITGLPTVVASADPRSCANSSSNDARAVATLAAKAIVQDFPKCSPQPFSWGHHLLDGKPLPEQPNAYQRMGEALRPILQALQEAEAGLFARNEFAAFGDGGRVPYWTCNPDVVFLCGNPLCRHTDARYNGGYPSLVLVAGPATRICVDRNVWYRSSVVRHEGRLWVPMLYDGGPNDLSIDMMLLNDDGTCEYREKAVPASYHNSTSLQIVGYLPFAVVWVLNSTEHPGLCSMVAPASAMARCPHRDTDDGPVSAQDIITAAQQRPAPPGPTGVVCYAEEDGVSTFNGWQHVHWIEGEDPRVYTFSKNTTLRHTQGGIVG